MPRMLFLLLLTVRLANAQTSIKEYRLGDTSISIQQETFPPANKGIYFINLHSNETTSIEATKQYLQAVGGIFMQLLHGESRHVQFELDNIQYKIDPNRIFTRLGRKATLQLNSAFNTGAEKEAANLADSILALMKQPQLIVAMHNNTNKGFSIDSYARGKTEAINAADVYINKAMDADDFVYTTEKRVFAYLKQQQINVVLQKARGFRDDGSLSVYCGSKHIPYINIEAEEGHKDEQLRMLQALTALIASYGVK